MASFSFVYPRETLEKELEEIKQHWNYVVVSHYLKGIHSQLWGHGDPDTSFLSV